MNMLNICRNLFKCNINNNLKIMRSISQGLRESKATVIHDESTKVVSISLRYINNELKINKLFTFERNSYERCSHVLCRISDKIFDYIHKKLNKKKVEPVCVPVIKANLILKKNGEVEEVGDLSCAETFLNGEDYCLSVGDYTYLLDVNPPLLTALELPKSDVPIMSGFFFYPSKLEEVNCIRRDISLKWYRSTNKFTSYPNDKGKTKKLAWEEFEDSFCISLADEDVSRMLKVVGKPIEGSYADAGLECISNSLVVPGPGPCPFEKRHKYTINRVGKNIIRVVSYNILADFYADSDYSRSTLFPTCPPHALDISYRKQLLLKEILGYNADLICLQEVDKKIFIRDFEPLFSHFGFKGIYDSKGGPSMPEGLATFYRGEKLRLKAKECFSLSEQLETNHLLSGLLKKVNQNPSLYASFMKQRTVLQATVFNSEETPSQILIVGVTHLYSDSESNHIRLLQSVVSLSLLQEVKAQQESENSGTNVAVIFCGDFNSFPSSAVYRLMTNNSIDEQDPDWSSKSEEEVRDVSFSHDLNLSSACGTPDYTNYTVGFQGCLDYIFYQSDKFSIEQTVPLPSHEEVTEHGALPSLTIPSDHLALVADLKWRKS